MLLSKRIKQELKALNFNKKQESKFIEEVAYSAKVTNVSFEDSAESMVELVKYNLISINKDGILVV